MFRQLRSRFPYIRGRHLYDAYAACLLIELASRTLARGVRQWEIYMGKEDSRDRAESS